MQLLNEPIGARQAVEWGMAARCVASDGLSAVVDEVCGRIAAKRPGSLRATRDLLRPRDYRERLEDERRCFVAAITSAEASAGMCAFVAGKAP